MIVRKNEPFKERPVIILIYGPPGVGKTGFANTSNNPILIDCDRGADRASNKVDTIVASRWQDILSDEHEIKNHSTAIIDTAKAMLDDFLMVHVCEKDNKLRWNKLKAYGAIGEEFKIFVNRRRAEQVDIVIVAHSREEKDGDNVNIVPDITGQSKSLLLRIADQVGYMYIENGHRVVNFEPTDRTIGKNVAKLQKTLVPDESDPRYMTAMSNVISKVKTSIAELSKAAVDAEKQLQSEITLDVQSIDNCKDLAELKNVFTSCKHRNNAIVFQAKETKKTQLENGSNK